MLISAGSGTVFATVWSRALIGLGHNQAAKAAYIFHAFAISSAWLLGILNEKISPTIQLDIPWMEKNGIGSRICAQNG